MSHNILQTSEAEKAWPWERTKEPLYDGDDWPKITVVTPSYNQGQYIEETIRSVVLQDYPNLEYILLDGGSTDGSLEIIQKYADSFVYWQSAPDNGQSAAINAGFEMATGDVFCWLNSDDVFAEGALWEVGRRLRGLEKAMLIGDSILTEAADVLTGQHDRRRPTWEEMAYEARTYPQPSVFWTSDLWEAVDPLDERLYFAMDYDLWLRMRPLAGEVVYVDRVLSISREHDEQKSKVEENEEQLRDFMVQRAWVAIRSAQNRGEHPLLWYLKAYGRRVSKAIQKKNMYLLRASYYQKVAWQLILNNVSSFGDPDSY